VRLRSAIQRAVLPALRAVRSPARALQRLARPRLRAWQAAADPQALRVAADPRALRVAVDLRPALRANQETLSPAPVDSAAQE
jgi:hypothetical protein